MYCRICGPEQNVKPRATYGYRAVCDSCNAETKRRKLLSRDEFDRRYWGSDYETVPHGVRREFYDDYVSSGLGYCAYHAQTVRPA